MKKVILSVLIASSLLAVSCKQAKKSAQDLKDATVEAADKAVDATKDAASAVKETAGDAVDAAGDAVDAAKDAVSGQILEGIEIPEFSNPEVAKNLADYAAYAKEYIAANGNVAKISELASKGKELLEKGKELASKLDATELAKYKSVLTAIQSKMAPAQ
ncbi:hypothetical protein [Tenacibaculum sp. UWU-22]|uniref:hypothetical protein n=1 Tax=Tenacibaculum sp. UWU-22 TaxID=3234187 RepID=UPI0034DB2E09